MRCASAAPPPDRRKLGFRHALADAGGQRRHAILRALTCGSGQDMGRASGKS
jgi:hypothetical protein